MVVIGTRNSLVPDDTKPLPGPMFFYQIYYVAFTKNTICQEVFISIIRNTSSEIPQRSNLSEYIWMFIMKYCIKCPSVVTITLCVWDSKTPFCCFIIFSLTRHRMVTLSMHFVCLFFYCQNIYFTDTDAVHILHHHSTSRYAGTQQD